MYVIKKDGTREEFNVDKIIAAVNKSAARILYEFSTDEIAFICQFAYDRAESLKKDGITIQEMHNIVEGALERVNPAVAKSYRDYRNYKLDFIHMMDEVYTKSQSIRYIGDKSNANTDSALVATKRSLINYYITIPASNIETALWLESDRMAGLNLSPSSLDIQKHVVIEEFKQRYLNNPYGDLWLKLRPLAYKVHPYRWATIGVSPEHIERATLEDVGAFFRQFYAPDNAIVSICGNIAEDKALELVKKWFGDIPPAHGPVSHIPAEPRQTEERRSIVPDNNVPADAIYKVFHMGGRDSDDFYACDIISDILSNGQSSRLYVNLIKNQRLFSGIDAYVSGDRDPGLFIFSGKLSEGIDIRQAEAAINQEIEHFIKDEITVREVEKIIHKTEARISYSEISYQSKASNLAFFEFLGDVDLINTEGKRYNNITVDKIKTTARELFRKENCSTLWYLKK